MQLVIYINLIVHNIIYQFNIGNGSGKVSQQNTMGTYKLTTGNSNSDLFYTDKSVFDENMKCLLLEEEEDKQAVPTNRSNPFLL